MKRLGLLLCAWLAIGAAELTDVHTVYLLPMAHGLDQYLANRLTNERVFLVVTKPAAADAVFTEQIGDAFRAQMETLLPPPPAKAPEKKEDAAKGAEKKDEAPRPTGSISDPMNKLDNPSLNSTWGRSRGNVFLVDPKTHQVVWSIYAPAKGSTSKDIDRTASDIVSRIKKDLAPAKK